VALTVGDAAPLAAPDAYGVDAGGTLLVAAPGILANDTDPNGDALTATLAAAPAHGSLALRGDGSFSYAADPEYTGPDAFTYVVSDGQLGSAPATVSLTVRPAPGSVQLSLTLSGSVASPAAGSPISFSAHVANTGALTLTSLRLRLSPAGVSLQSAAAGTAAVDLQGNDVLLPPLAAGASLDVSLDTVVTAAAGARAGVSALVSGSDGTALTQPAKAYFSAGPLSLEMGGCGCTGSHAGEALSWFGIAGLLWRRRRRR